MRGRPALTPDVRARIRLDALSGNLAMALARGETTEARAVAELALVAPCRPDLIDTEMPLIDHGRRRNPELDWPSTDARLMLLTRARRVTVGDVALVGPGGVRLSQVSLTWAHGQPPQPRLKLERNGTEVGLYRTVEELARYVDLTTLVEELPPAVEPG